MDQDKKIQELLSTIQSSINSFNKGLSGVQSKMFDEILSLIKDLELSDNNIKNSTANLKLAMQISNKLQRIIISKEYQSNLKTFVKSFNNIDKLQRDYFMSYLDDDKLIPTEKLSLIKEYSIGSTIDALTEKGLGVNVIGKIENVIRQSTTTGGDFPNLQNQLRDLIIANKGEGVLEKYASTVANDTINQYNRQVMETTSMDLNMPWRRYVGSLKTTSREWCERMVAKKYIHVSELPVLVKGNIDGHQCAIYKKTPENKGTDLPYGLETGTDAQNVLVRAGGHGCDHSFYPCLESEVPKEILEKFNKKEPVKKEEPKQEENINIKGNHISKEDNMPESSLLHGSEDKKIELNPKEYNDIIEYDNGSTTAIHKQADKGDDFDENIESIKLYAKLFKNIQALVAIHNKTLAKSPELLLNGIKADNKKPNHSDYSKGTNPYKTITSAISNAAKSAIKQDAIPVVILEKRYTLDEIIKGVFYSFNYLSKDGNQINEIHLRYRNEGITIITREDFNQNTYGKKRHYPNKCVSLKS